MEGLPHVGGEDPLDGIHEIGGGVSGPLRARLQGQAGERAHGVEHIGEHQADDAGDGGGTQEVGHRLPAHGPYLLHVVHGQDAINHTQQHHGHHDELQKVDEDVAEGLQVAGGKGRTALEAQAEPAQQDAKEQCDQDLHRQTQFLLHKFFSLFHKITDDPLL